MNKWNRWDVSQMKIGGTTAEWREQKYVIDSMKQLLRAYDLESPPTDFLYHYTSRVGMEHNESLIRMIAGEVFYFSNPLHFNDPLDLAPRIVAKEPADSAGVRVIGGLPNGGLGLIPIETLPGMAEHLARFSSDTIQEGKDVTRVLCTSESPDNALMWAHYANRHTGICIELDWTKLHPPLLPQQVVYQAQMTLAAFNAPRLRVQKPHLCVKTPEWGYEREWRLFQRVQDKMDTCFVKLGGAVKGVIFGTKISRQDQVRIFNLVCTCVPSVRIRQAYFDGANVRTYELPRSLASLGAELHPKNIRLNLDALPDTYLGSTLDGDGAVLHNFGNAVGVRQVSKYAMRVLEFFGAVHGSADKLLSAIQVVLPDLSRLPICEVVWEIVCSASRHSENAPLKDAVSRWCPEEFVPLLSDSQRMNLGEKDRRRAMIEIILFAETPSRLELALSGLDQLEEDAKTWSSADSCILSSMVYWCAKRLQHTGVPEADEARVNRLLSFAETIKLT